MSKKGISQKPWHLGNFPDTQAFGNFLKYFKCTTIRFRQEFWKFREFSKCLSIWEVFQMPLYMENFPNAWIFEKFLLESDGGVFEIYMIKQDISINVPCNRRPNGWTKWPDILCGHSWVTLTKKIFCFNCFFCFCPRITPGPSASIL